MIKLDENTILKLLAEEIKADFNGIDIWEFCTGMELEKITGYRIIFRMAPTINGQYQRAYKFIDLGIENSKLFAQSQTRHSITIDYSNPESITALYIFIKQECFMKRPSRLHEYRAYDHVNSNVLGGPTA